DSLGALVAPYPLEDLKAADFGQLEIEQDKLRHVTCVAAGIFALAKYKIDGFGAIPGDFDAIGHVRFLQGAQRQKLIVWIIFHQQYQLVRHVSAWLRPFAPQASVK